MKQLIFAGKDADIVDNPIYKDAGDMKKTTIQRILKPYAINN
jgi:hypothetical protein